MSKSMPMPITARLKRSEPILICAKCLKKLSDGKAIKRKLKSRLRRHGPAESRSKPKLVLTSCVGICPKRAVAVSNGILLARGEYLLVDKHNIKSAASALTTRTVEPASS